MHEVLDARGEDENEDVRSLDQLAPRLQLADAVLMVHLILSKSCLCSDVALALVVHVHVTA